MRAWIWIVVAASALTSCGDDRRATTYRRTDGCAAGSFLNCQCANGASGVSTCDGQKYGACACEGFTPDAGPGADAGAAQDSGRPADDAGLEPRDAGAPQDAGFVDAGPPPDAGFHDSGVRPDAGFPDSGVRPDAGFPDSGVRPDAGFADSGVPPGPCVADSECGPPFMVCEAGQCVPGCYPGGAGGLTCADPNDCNPLTGRCDGFSICLDDSFCNPPLSVCEILFCVPGCQVAGAPPCASGTACNPSTGHCQ